MTPRVALAAASLLLAVTACGQDDSGDPPDAPPADSPSAEADPLTIADVCEVLRLPEYGDVGPRNLRAAVRRFVNDTAELSGRAGEMAQGRLAILATAAEDLGAQAGTLRYLDAEAIMDEEVKSYVDLCGDRGVTPPGS